MTNVGGDFDRDLRFSVYLTLLGILTPSPSRPDRWLGRSREESDTGAFKRVDLLAEPHDPEDEIRTNSVAFELDMVDTDSAEIGSRKVRGAHGLMVSIYAENDTIGRMIRGDIHAGLSQATIPVVDGTTAHDATPTVVAYAEVEGLRLDKASGFTDAWRRHWFTVEATLEV